MKNKIFFTIATLTTVTALNWYTKNAGLTFSQCMTIVGFTATYGFFVGMLNHKS